MAGSQASQPPSMHPCSPLQQPLITCNSCSATPQAHQQHVSITTNQNCITTVSQKGAAALASFLLPAHARPHISMPNPAANTISRPAQQQGRQPQEWARLGSKYNQVLAMQQPNNAYRFPPAGLLHPKNMHKPCCKCSPPALIHSPHPQECWQGWWPAKEGAAHHLEQCNSPPMPTDFPLQASCSQKHAQNMLQELTSSLNLLP